MQSGITLKKCNIHFFKLKQKAVIALGECEVTVIGSNIVLKSKQNKLEIPKGNFLVRLRQLHYCTYLFPRQSETVYTISIPGNDAEAIGNFQGFITKHIEIKDFYSLPADSDIKSIIAVNCPLGSSSQQLGSNNEDQLNSAGKTIGGIFGSISALFELDQLNKDTRDTINRIQQNNLGTGTESGWGRFKIKCSQLNKKVADGMKPVSESAKKTVSGIGVKFDNSNNSFIKNVRQWSNKTQNSLNQGFVEAQIVGNKRQSMGVQSQRQSTVVNQTSKQQLKQLNRKSTQ